MACKRWNFAQENMVGLCMCKDCLQGGSEKKAGAELGCLGDAEEEPPLRWDAARDLQCSLKGRQGKVKCFFFPPLRFQDPHPKNTIYFRR